MSPNKDSDKALRIVSVLTLLGAFIIIGRLFVLQVFDHKYYTAMALSNHEIYKQLYPHRGSIFLQDTRTTGKEYPVAVNREYYSLYAVPRDIPPDQIVVTADFISNLFGYSEIEKNNLITKLSKKNDPYEPIAKKISEDFKDKIEIQNLVGIYTAGQEFRYYPEANLAASVLGFTSQNEKGQLVGRYGVEGFLDNILTGHSGFLAGEKGALGSIIPMADRTVKQAEDGANLLLTIDRNLQYKACERLRQGFEQYQAKSASLILMDPKTGAILAMCSLPDFNPNDLSGVKDVSVFNNTTIFTSYEPGSVFKPIVMATALDLELVSPFTTYVDTGERIVNGEKIHNALNKVYGLSTMTNVLESSINTGMIYVAEKINRVRFKEYVEKFGFGKKTGISLDTELPGDIDLLSKTSAIYTAVGSFGQGLTATPLQVVTAYAIMANGGNMPTPYIIDEIRHANGQIDKTEPEMKLVISPNTAKLITAMLISVVEKTYSKAVGLKDYYIAGKTGTAQIPAKNGGYEKDKTNHTFVGFFPATDPKFVLLVKYEEPKQNWAESTAAPVFKDVAKFVLEYSGTLGDK